MLKDPGDEQTRHEPKRSPALPNVNYFCAAGLPGKASLGSIRSAEHRAWAGRQAASMSVGPAGGLRASNPLLARWRRIFPITLGSVMNAMIRIVPPQRGHTSGSAS